LQTFLSLEQVIDNDRQLIAVEMESPQVLQVFKLFFVQIFELAREAETRRRENCLPTVKRKKSFRRAAHLVEDSINFLSFPPLKLRSSNQR
jgi:hypothetical protein